MLFGKKRPEIYHALRELLDGYELDPPPLRRLQALRRSVGR